MDSSGNGCDMLMALQRASSCEELRRLLRWMPYQAFWVKMRFVHDDNDVELALHMLFALRRLIEEELSEEEYTGILGLATSIVAEWSVKVTKDEWKERILRAIL